MGGNLVCTVVQPSTSRSLEKKSRGCGRAAQPQRLACNAAPVCVFLSFFSCWWWQDLSRTQARWRSLALGVGSEAVGFPGQTSSDEASLWVWCGPWLRFSFPQNSQPSPFGFLNMTYDSHQQCLPSPACLFWSLGDVESLSPPWMWVSFDRFCGSAVLDIVAHWRKLMVTPSGQVINRGHK